MHGDHPSIITRRSALASFGGIAGVAALSSGCTAEKNSPHAEKETPDATPRPRKLSELREEFERLLPLWQEERKLYILSSNTNDYWKGPHGKAIIALGPAIIPYLIKQLKAGDFFFNVPLALITNIDVANGNSEQANSKLWVEWWESAKK